MAFADYETADGSPIELLTFSNGLQTFKRSNTVAAIQVVGSTFLPLAYKRTAFGQSKDADDNNITMRVPREFEVVGLYGGILTSNVTTVTIERFHNDDPAQQLQVAWKGQVVSVDRKKDEAIMLLQPITSGAEATPADTFSGLCNSFLFDGACRLARDDWRYIATLTSISADGLELVFNGLRTQAVTLDTAGGGPTGPLSAAELDVYWQGGYVQTGNQEVRSIVEGDVNSDPDRVRIDLPFRDFVVGEGASVYAGCDLTLATCHKKFDNAINHQGYAYIPEIDPANTELPSGSSKRVNQFAGPQA